MIKRKLLTLSIILAIVITPILSCYSVSSSSPNPPSHLNALDNAESHIIEGVPYVSQETGFYCSYATITMILRYYGINTTLKEVLHHSGIGYSLFYNNIYYITRYDPILSEPSYFRYPIPGYEICQFNGDELASLFNLTHNHWFPDQNNCSIELNWEEYWSKVKKNITNDTPVITSVNTLYLPFANFSSGHAVVIVGFNQSHVFYNDPATALFSNPEDGFYANLSIDVFQKAVNSTPATRFSITTFENTSNICYNRTKAFEKAHKRNIKRLKGFILEHSPSINFGINAVKLYRRDLRIGPLHRMFTVMRNWDYCKQNGSLAKWFYLISIERYNISQYLLENRELSPKICTYDGSLLENESKCWKNIAEYALEFEKIAKKYGFLKTLILSIPITAKMKKTLNEIISIEKAIIRGPAE